MNVKQSSAGGTTAISGAGISLGSVIPINDIRGLEGMSYTKNEKLLRCKLAAVYRLVDMYGWTQSIYNHISVIELKPNFIIDDISLNLDNFLLYIFIIVGTHQSGHRTLSHQPLWNVVQRDHSLRPGKGRHAGRGRRGWNDQFWCQRGRIHAPRRNSLGQA